MTESHKTIYEALLAIQRDIEAQGEPLKDAKNPHFKSKYVDLASLRAYLRPLLNKHGILVTHDVFEDRLRTTARLTIDGPATQTEADVPLTVEKQTPQGMGSALTYACRYSLCLLFGISGDDDDDGNEASKPSAAVENAVRGFQDRMDRARDVAELTAIAAEVKAAKLEERDQTHLKACYNIRKAKLQGDA